MITECSGVYKPETYIGLYKDNKPEDAVNGSCWIEMDTGKIYLYNADAQEWVEWGA